MSLATGDDRGRLAAAADRAEIIELLPRYALMIDTWQWELLPQIFTADARLDFESVDRYVESDSVVRGLEDIRAWYEAALKPFPDVLHFMSNHMIDLEGDRARTYTYMHVLNMSMGGIYRGEAVRTSEGWRLERFSLEERTFDEAAARLRAHMGAIDSAD